MDLRAGKQNQVFLSTLILLLSALNQVLFYKLNLPSIYPGNSGYVKYEHYLFFYQLLSSGSIESTAVPS